MVGKAQGPEHCYIVSTLQRQVDAGAKLDFSFSYFSFLFRPQPMGPYYPHSEFNSLETPSHTSPEVSLLSDSKSC